MATIFLFSLICFILKKTNDDFALDIVVLSTTFITLIRDFYNRRIIKQKIEKGSKRWLLEDMILNQGDAWLFLMGVNLSNVLSLIDIDYTSNFATIFISTISVMYFLLMYICFYVLPPKASQFLEEHYPEYKFKIA
ncbi:MAG: hypothetical protein KGV44_01425 [Flavobacteriaceae bacterium]|nr:hypothetical protein [Flavobacteriaceae bacterium]